LNFDILTLFPEMFDGYLRSSILGRTIEQGLVRVRLTNIRDFARDKHRTCDDAPFGGGAGMLLKPEPLARALDAVGGGERRTVYLTPSGRLFDQEYAEDLAGAESMILLCGHYEGIDQRIVDRYVSDEISVGNYVLFSGEVGAMVILDAVVRLLAGVIRHESLRSTPIRLASTRSNSLLCSISGQSQYPGLKRMVTDFPDAVYLSSICR